MVFGEKLPGLWWVGASGLVVGNVVIGRREEEGDNPKPKAPVATEHDGAEERRERYRDNEGGDNGDGGISDGVELGSKKTSRGEFH